METATRTRPEYIVTILQKDRYCAGDKACYWFEIVRAYRAGRVDEDRLQGKKCLECEGRDDYCPQYLPRGFGMWLFRKIKFNYSSKKEI